MEHCEQLIERLHELDFEIDGLVLKANRFDQRDRLGATSKAPRWVIAYKFEKYEATTRVNAIRVQVGKTGTITPVADLEPVELAGTTVSRASLHNAEEIAAQGRPRGRRGRGGEGGQDHSARRPRRGGRAEGRPAEVRLPQEMPGVRHGGRQGRRRRLHPLPQSRSAPRSSRSGSATLPAATPWTSKGWATSSSINSSTRGSSTSYGDLYRLTADNCMDLERMGRKSAENLLAGIEASKGRGLARLLNALSIRHVGNRVARCWPSGSARWTPCWRPTKRN